jgi:hypothetical protein
MAVYTPNTLPTIHATREGWLVAARNILAAERFSPAGLTIWKTLHADGKTRWLVDPGCWIHGEWVPADQRQE